MIVVDLRGMMPALTTILAVRLQVPVHLAAHFAMMLLARAATQDPS